MHNPGELRTITAESNAGPISANGTIQPGNKDGVASLEGSRGPRQGEGRRARDAIKRLRLRPVQKRVPRSDDEGPHDYARTYQRDSP